MRKKSAAKQPRTSLNIRVSHEEKRLMLAAGKRAGAKDLSEWVRRASIEFKPAKRGSKKAYALAG